VNALADLTAAPEWFAMARRLKRKSSTPKKRMRRTAAEPPTSVKRGELPPLSADERARLRVSLSQESDRGYVEEARGWRSKSTRAAASKPPLPKIAGKRARGAERTYDREAIRGVAKEFPAAPGEPKSWWFDRVREECRHKRPVIKTPKNDRTMARIVGDLYAPPPAEARRASD
jgi:hypothetical protein